MNLAEAAQLILTLSLKDEVSSGLRGIQKSLDSTSKKSASLQSGLGKIGAGIGVGIRNTAKIGAVGLGLLWTQVDAGIDSLVELEDVMNQTEAVIESTGGVAGLTAEEVRELANQMEELSGVDDKVIQSGANVLLTFKEIGEDIFPEATLAALDMSEAMDQDLQSSIVQIGKALNDPIAGISALTRVGVTFTQEQKDVIKALVETGDVAGAQAVIIAELNSEFGGSAQASMEGYRGTQIRLKDTWEELQQTLATALLPALDNLSRTLREKLMDPQVKEGVKKLGEGIAQLFSAENVKGGGEALKGLFTFLKELPWSAIKDGLSFAAENAKKVVDVFRSLPPGVQAGLLTFLAANKLSGGLIASGLGELVKVALSSLRTITAGHVTVVGGSVTGGGVPGAPGAPVPGKGPSNLVTLAGVATGVGAVLVADQIAAAEMATITEQAQNLNITATQTQRDTGNIALNALQTVLGIGNLLMPVHGTLTEAQKAVDLAQQALNADSSQAQRADLAAAEIRDRISTNVARTDHQTQVITGVGADHRQALHDVYLQSVEQKRLQLIGNHVSAEVRDRISTVNTRLLTTNSLLQNIHGRLGALAQIARSRGQTIADRADFRYPGLAHGGPTYPGETYVVGEGGRPELLHMGSRRGYVEQLGGRQRIEMTVPVTVNLSTRQVVQAQDRYRAINAHVKR